MPDQQLVNGGVGFALIVIGVIVLAIFKNWGRK